MAVVTLAALFDHRRAHPLVTILFLLLLVALIVLAVVLIVRLIRSPLRPSPGSEAARARPQGWPPTSGPPSTLDPVLTELRMRYARGEISREEYLQRAADLGLGLPYEPRPGPRPEAGAWAGRETGPRPGPRPEAGAPAGRESGGGQGAGSP